MVITLLHYIEFRLTPYHYIEFAEIRNKSNLKISKATMFNTYHLLCDVQFHLTLTLNRIIKSFKLIQNLKS